METILQIHNKWLNMTRLRYKWYIKLTIWIFNIKMTMYTKATDSIVLLP